MGILAQEAEKRVITRRPLTMRVALAATAVFGMLGIAVSGTTTAQFTEASWTDREIGQASAKARWMEGYTRVTDPGWKMSGERDSDLPDTTVLGGPDEVTRDFAITYPHVAGTIPADGSDHVRDSTQTGAQHEAIVPERQTSDDLWMGTRDDTGMQIASARHCMAFPDPSAIAASTTSCAASTPSRLVSTQHTDGYSFSIRSAESEVARVNVGGFSSSASCLESGTTTAGVDDSAGVLQLANDPIALDGDPSSKVDLMGIIPAGDDPSIRFDGMSDQWIRYSPHATSTNDSFVLVANIRKNTFRTPYYALAEMDLIVQIYSSEGSESGVSRYVDQINLPITRSECGFSDGSAPLPPGAGTWRGTANQLGWPGRSLGDSAPGISTRTLQFSFDSANAQLKGLAAPLSRRFLQPAPETTTLTSMPPTTTATSPLESTTATATTTSAPPDPSATDPAEPSTSSTVPVTTPVPTSATSETTTPLVTPTVTSTPATPGLSIPTEPGDLSTTAQTETAGTVKVDGTDNDVVVKGDDLPADARTAAGALDTWINDARQPGGDWTAFTSTDPTSDGWRWAAINQRTGTVVYLR